jgi:hypothetical protein
MKTEEFFSELAKIAVANEYKFEDLRARIPLGVDETGRIALSVDERLREGRKSGFGHTCVTGTGKTDFIRRLVLTLSGVYEAERITFLIVSPSREYAELVRLKGADVFAPVINSLDELWTVLSFVRSQAELRKKSGQTLYGKLFLVLDGLETLANGSLEVYLPFFKIASEGGVDVITGVELSQSAFARSPENFVGAENCLVTVMAPGSGDVTYVGENLALSLPKSFVYPEETEFADAVTFVNGL